MKKFKLIALGLAVATVSSSIPASAVTIVLNNQGGVAAGSRAFNIFTKAARYWESQLTNNATINLNVRFASLGAAGANVLGQTGSKSGVVSIGDYSSRLISRQTSSLDALASGHLPGLNANGGISVVTPGYIDSATQAGINARTRVYDTDGSINNQFIQINSANAKVLGFSTGADGTDFTTGADGSITFNSDFSFDFNASNGTTAGQINFLVVAIHEIGHALGFVSGVDDYDFFAGPNGPGAATFLSGAFGDNNPNNFVWGSALDLFRYSADREGFSGNASVLDWSIRNGATDGANFAQPFFSVDGGATRLFNNLLSRGQFNTNSFQASHWRCSCIAGQPFLGIMDPVGSPENFVTGLDLAAFDAIGYDLSRDVLEGPYYTQSTAQIFNSVAVPEPSAWAMMIAGFGLMGAALRRRARKLVSVFA
jgi:hypothetical protein